MIKLTGNPVYDQYIGSEVSVTKSSKHIESISMDISCYELDKDDRVTAIIRASHPDVRVWLPDTCGTADFKPTRLNVYISEYQDGKYVISGMEFG